MTDSVATPLGRLAVPGPWADPGDLDLTRWTVYGWRPLPTVYAGRFVVLRAATDHGLPIVVADDGSTARLVDERWLSLTAALIEVRNALAGTRFNRLVELAPLRPVVHLADGTSGRLMYVWPNGQRAKVIAGGRHRVVPYGTIVGVDAPPKPTEVGA